MTKTSTLQAERRAEAAEAMAIEAQEEKSRLKAFYKGVAARKEEIAETVLGGVTTVASAGGARAFRKYVVDPVVFGIDFIGVTAATGLIAAASGKLGKFTQMVASVASGLGAEWAVTKVGEPDTAAGVDEAGSVEDEAGAAPRRKLFPRPRYRGRPPLHPDADKVIEVKYRPPDGSPGGR